MDFSDRRKALGTASAGEESDMNYGAWALPFYNQSSQKQKNNVAGYNAKTTGGVFGFDILPSDDTMLGTAVAITKTDMKYKMRSLATKRRLTA
ncbi:autotransporter outer membrane beta-barrel domain-containing protein [Rickettsia endosymbiont of Halotydeus destructor]|uniref:autotransporter outer membrane beta-barrel domain-containing protein n=1 Tax=Rickettsia endosymbiont of Halotydeus destructor TaxID=2996754 RepID=UPI003BAF88F7